VGETMMLPGDERLLGQSGQRLAFRAKVRPGIRAFKHNSALFCAAWLPVLHFLLCFTVHVPNSNHQGVSVNLFRSFQRNG